MTNAIFQPMVVLSLWIQPLSERRSRRPEHRLVVQHHELIRPQGDRRRNPQARHPKEIRR